MPVYCAKVFNFKCEEKMSSLDSCQNLNERENHGRGKGKGRRAVGHEGMRAKRQTGKRAKGQNYKL